MSEPGDEDSDPMRPEAWFKEPNVCGSCIAWRADRPREGEDVAAGSCRLRSELPRVPASLRKCDLYKPRGKYVYKPSKSAPKSRRKKASTVRVMRRDAESGEMVTTSAPTAAQASVSRERPSVPREIELGTDDRSMVRGLLQEILHEEIPRTERAMIERFEGGQVSVIDAEGERRDLPVERFFSLLEDFRSSLDALDAQMKSKEALRSGADEQKRHMGGVKGSLTTFNFLYANRSDYFTSKG